MQAHWLDAGPDATIGADHLAANGVHHRVLSTVPADYQAPLDALKAERGYIEQDVVALLPTTPNLDAICAKFDAEHHHDDDEVRFVLEGEGIFDIRDDDDRWMRIIVEAGDLIVVPAGRHHRFLLTEARTIRCVRLFQDEAGWVPHYRAAG